MSNNIRDNIFYFVWSPQGEKPPRVCFCYESDAQRAAKSMAEQHQGQEFFVMKSLSKAQYKTVHTERLKEFDDIPF